MSEEPQILEEHRYELRSDGDVHLARNQSESVAETAGFSEMASKEIAIVAAELAANVLEHADSGELTVARITNGTQEGVRLESLDAGPGIDDIDAVFADGHSTTGGLGGGLGAVNRLMDRVTVAEPGEPNYGTHVLADRWVRPEYERTMVCPLDFGAASRSKSPTTPNGDSFVLKRWNDQALVGVIDGLGHGLRAHQASTAAKQYVENHFDCQLTGIFQGANRACRGTRGVVMALARFDWAAQTVTVAGVGNIDYKIDGPDDTGIVMRRGVVGNSPPDPLFRTIDWHTDYRMALYSDGVSSRWNWQDCADIVDKPATVQARRLLSRFGKDSDDATVFVVAEDNDSNQN